jgi:hypothetical protein
MRKGFNTLAGLVTNVGGSGLMEGSAYVFVNKTRTTLKILHWARNVTNIKKNHYLCGRNI